MKVLFLATYGDFLATFELSNIQIMKELGCSVYCASNFSEKQYNRKNEVLEQEGVKKYEISFSRSPFDLRNIKTLKELIKLIQQEGIDIIDCHNAVVGAYARIAAKICGIKKVIYTPHSFFFYSGCPAKNKIVFKPIETILSTMTDLLIAINREDYIAATKMPIRGKAQYVPGVGINLKEIFDLPIERIRYRTELNIPNTAKIFISVGELIPRKNHITAINAFAEAHLYNAYYIICGIGQLEDELQKHINQIGMSDRIKLLGYRNDVKSLMKAADVFLLPSLQEGLPVALMEAMACGLPCIVSNIRGNVDLIVDTEGGYLFEAKDKTKLCQLIKKIDKDVDNCNMGEKNKANINKYDISCVKKIMINEYSNLMGR